MRIFKTLPERIGVLVVAGLFVGCSGGTPGQSVVEPTTVSRYQLNTFAAGWLSESHAYISVRPFTVYPNRRKTWISPGIGRKQRLLFQSDASYGTVNIYALPSLTLKGSITGFSAPQGECSDASGNIWVANLGPKQMVKLSRGGSILNTLSDPTGVPVGCAINPKNGDLAVTNIQGSSYSYPGEVLIYPGASGTPTELSCSSLRHYYFDGYDKSGHLMVSGSNDGVVGLCYGNKNSLSPVTLSGGTIYFPGAVQWSPKNNYWNVFDQLCGNASAACVYWVTVSGSVATITGSTTLANYAGGSVCDLVQGVMSPGQQTHILGGDYEVCGASTKSSVNRWPNPAGGVPTNYNHDTNYIKAPIGAAVSAVR